MIDDSGLWTLAYRKPRANKFHRVTNWSGSWNEASHMASRLREVTTGLEIWYVPTRDAELSGYSGAEDHGNILVDSGKRVRITETGTLPSELL